VENKKLLLSISSMFFAACFLYKFLASKITKLAFGFKILAAKILYKKPEQKMLMKLTPVGHRSSN
jgi:hypothetical protein